MFTKKMNRIFSDLGSILEAKMAQDSPWEVPRIECRKMKGKVELSLKRSGRHVRVGSLKMKK